jgi:Asp-tRNA(Asn)/Glu-tRNA(Gln) amidotransferase A subunit family amidase
VLTSEGSTLRARTEAQLLAQGEQASFAAGGSALRRLGELLPASYYLHAQRIRRMLIDLTGDWFRSQGLDAAITAVTPTAAPKGLESTGDPSLLAPWSHLGFPAIALQSGQFTPEGLPLAVQLGAPPLADYELLCAGAWIEGVLGRLPVPPLS